MAMRHTKEEVVSKLDLILENQRILSSDIRGVKNILHGENQETGLVGRVNAIEHVGRRALAGIIFGITALGAVVYDIIKKWVSDGH